MLSFKTGRIFQNNYSYNISDLQLINTFGMCNLILLTSLGQAIQMKPVLHVSQLKTPYKPRGILSIYNQL